MIVLFDIDGTLSDPTHRREHLKIRDWDTFFSKMGEDPARTEYCRLCEILLTLEGDLGTGSKRNYEVIVLFATGRPANYRGLTEKWLIEQDLIDEEGSDRLYMRPEGDSRSDVIIKQEILDQIKKDYPAHTIELVVDDRPSVIEMWKRNRLEVLVAPGWDREGFERIRKPRLDVMVGPSGGGKSTFAESSFEPDSIISADKIRQDLLGDWRDQSKNEVVFYAAHSLIKARLELGLDAVMDATNLKNRDRKALLDVVPDDCYIVYNIINRPMEEKVATDTWRADVITHGKPLMEYHEDVFKSNLKDILAGDGDKRVTVADWRAK